MNVVELQNDYTAEEYGANTNLTEMEFRIYDTVKRVVNSTPNHTSNTEWTKQIKIEIGELGFDEGYEVYSTFHDRELLYDLLWCSKKDGCIQSVKLILESELNHRPRHKELVWDFEKLLIGNAENRVLICFNEGNSNLPHNMISTISMFNDCCRHFENRGNEVRILVIIIDDFNGDVVPHVISV